jgi:DNA end-binding protein Ku
LKWNSGLRVIIFRGEGAFPDLRRASYFLSGGTALMARPIWKGNISFGLVNIPITLYTAEQKSELHFKLLDKRTSSEIRYERVNEETKQEVPWDQIVKGYEYDPGRYVVVTEEDFRKAAVEATQTIEITDFVDLASIGYAYFEKPYYVVPGKKAEKGYVLLREVLKRTSKVAIAQVVIRSRQYLSALIPQGNALVLNILRYHHELRDSAEFNFPAGGLSEDYKVSEKEMEIAKMLVDSMSTDWDPARYHDKYRDALMEWIEKKAAAGGALPAEEAPAPERRPAKVIDMMDLLKQSVQQVSKGRRKETGTRERSEQSRKSEPKPKKAAGGEG